MCFAEELEQKLAEEAEQQETQREIKELEELIPDIESKVISVVTSGYVTRGEKKIVCTSVKKPEISTVHV